RPSCPNQRSNSALTEQWDSRTSILLKNEVGLMMASRCRAGRHGTLGGHSLWTADFAKGRREMQLPDRLRLELARYLIGPKLRVLRLRRSMGLLQLGERTGLSPSLLSRVENGKHLPTVPTLLRIALVFDVTLDHFFRNDKRQRVISITR